MPKTLSCPTCNASLPPSAAGRAVTCSFCGNHVVVPPDESAPAHAHSVQTGFGAPPPTSIRPAPGPGPLLGPSPVTSAPQSRGGGGVIAMLLVVGLLGVGGWIVLRPVSSVPVTGSEVGAGDPVEAGAPPAAAPQPAPEDGPVSTIGSAGTGVGQLDDAREIGFGTDDLLHVGEFSSGRIQRFTVDGDVVNQFIATDGTHVLQEMAVARDGTTYVIQGFDVHAYSPTGQRLTDVTYPSEEFIVVRDSVTPLPDGGLLVVERGTTLVWLDTAGQVVRRVSPEVLANGPGLDRVAVDGQGTVFGTGLRAGPGTLDAGVFVFDREGVFRTFFGSDDAFGLNASAAIAVDGQSRVAVTSSGGVQLFTADGFHLGTIEVRPASGLAFDDDGMLWIALRDRVEAWEIPGPR